MDVSREQVLAYRVRAQQLHDSGGPLEDRAVLDLGVQDTGADGAGWALLNRGVDAGPPAGAADDLVLAWTLRGAPHLYRRRDAAGVAAAVAPFSEADAAKRIFDAARPLRAAGIEILTALDVVAGQMREIVTRPTVKGELSAQLTARLDPPYLRDCRPCHALHTYEQPFRLAALRAGLELVPGTSPPVLTRIAGWRGPARTVPEALDVVRGYLRLLGPATPQMVAGFLDAPVKEVRARWPEDAEEVTVAGQKRSVLGQDRDALAAAPVDDAVRLLAPFDLFLQAKDRELLVPDAERRKQLWVVLGRPGAVLRGAEVVGTWRPRTSGKRLRLLVDAWSAVPSGPLEEQGERLAAYRGVAFDGVEAPP
ncbi:MAG TPA: crosslink repair DNA glycosylase YcaQ family protein [Nocardioidaceae bacterium]|nr:crosslink repair DNA glycosylase YcaQ family protein [Nocardioidaceae bacterium]